MLVLHGIYDHGRIEILDKDLPDICSEVEIILSEKTQIEKAFSSLNKISIPKDFHFNREEMNER